MHFLEKDICRKWDLNNNSNKKQLYSPESTMMSSSSPDPSSSLNTTCFPWRNTVLFPEKPSTFCTFTTPSSRSRPSHWWPSFGSSLQGRGLGRRWEWMGMLISSSGSSLIIRLVKDTGYWTSVSAACTCCALLSSLDSCSLSFLLFFFFSFSAFLRSSGWSVVIVCCREESSHVSKRIKEKQTPTRIDRTSTSLTSFFVWLESVATGCGRFLFLSWGIFGGRGEHEDGGPGVQPSLSAVLPVLLGGLVLLRSGETCYSKDENNGWDDTWIHTLAQWSQTFFFSAPFF